MCAGHEFLRLPFCVSPPIIGGGSERTKERRRRREEDDKGRDARTDGRIEQDNGIEAED